MNHFLTEFKEFAMRGNVIDLAVGVVIGTAFGRITSSLVNDLIMPLLGILTGSTNFGELTWTVVWQSGEEVIVSYGNFIQVIVDFLIIALAVFVAIKFINRLQRSREQQQEAENKENSAPVKKEEVQLLEEIRDALKK